MSQVVRQVQQLRQGNARFSEALLRPGELNEIRQALISEGNVLLEILAVLGRLDESESEPVEGEVRTYCPLCRQRVEEANGNDYRCESCGVSFTVKEDA